MAEKEIRWIGLDFSTTGLAAVGRTADGEEVFASTPMMGAMLFLGQPAHCLNLVPFMVAKVLADLESQGFIFANKGDLCLSVRQHDLAILGLDNQPIVPALSWQFREDDPDGDEQVIRLQEAGFEAQVGTIERRFILPKLMWLFEELPDLKGAVSSIMTTGDWIGLILTGKARLSTSDALSNALLLRTSKELAYDVLRSVGLHPFWFPVPIQSGQLVAVVQKPTHLFGLWDLVKKRLAGWSFHAGLGDNDAGARGSGLADFVTLVVSLGSSGTVTRIARAGASLAGKVLTFEYFDHTLLLNMLAQCAAWYNEWKENHPQAREMTHQEIDTLIVQKVGFDDVQPIKPGTTPGHLAEWELSRQAAAIQKSIAFEIVERVADMLLEVQDLEAPTIKKVVITGGLKRSPFLLYAIAYYLRNLAPTLKLYVSGLSAPFSEQAAARGAMITAMIRTGRFHDYCSVARTICPIEPL